jgi:hypothetical protein
MAIRSDLIGAGFPALQARMLGWNPAASVTAAGSTAAGATELAIAQDFVLMTATGADGIRMPTTATIRVLWPYVIANTSASTGIVYPHTGGNFTGGSTDAGISVPTRKSIIVMRYSATGYMYNLSA